MQGYTAEYAALSAQSRVHVSRVDVYRGSELKMTLLVHAGGVTADKNNKFMRRLECTISGIDPRTGEELSPTSIRDILAPFGTELWPYVGTRIPIEVEVGQLYEEEDDWNEGVSFGMTVVDGALVMAA